ncbi:ADP-ribosylglycohydrolase family protein [Paenibacillus flagellatus]|uniref:ADP-ribosylglycohydrolase family protein n=1 Tax=Paenibacillus flagellatus TaxID=2211139 RepID=A0A2V5KD04_9BACL|nr:ADP-ribosylglycohydrolase family protein [Paenibacillus flagellatus]PYI57521.1 ADP-ribosylglycohydrolase family protein [Paenibacillus flagellatus]
MTVYDTNRLTSLIRLEIVQRREEGCDVAGFGERLDAAAGAGRDALMALYRELAELPVSPDFPFEEPSELEPIRRSRPEGRRSLEANVSSDESAWKDKMYGAWLGRCAGCALGKPFETGAFVYGTADAPPWKHVHRWLEGADAWPIRGYVPETSRAAAEFGLKLNPQGMDSTRERIRFMETDDDIRYTVLALKLLEEKGLDWTSWDIGRLWHRLLPAGQTYTAEWAAYFNALAIDYPGRDDADADAKRHWVRTHLNPYREWIGAQIRADGWAYAAAGRPELAAELAWRDASFSHVKNGIYGAMFVAAMIAAAFVVNDPEEIVRIGLGEIPAGSRLARDIARAVDIARTSDEPLALVERLHEAFGHYHPIHTNNNAALVAAALVFGRGDFETSIGAAVLGGWDTDCNGATVGSILGASLGASGLPARWTEPLRDTLHAEVPGFHPIRISECADRTYEVFRRFRETTTV